MSEKQGIFSIGDTDNPKRQLDVIFVHGLGGDAYSTWQSSIDENLFWPKWLADDLDKIGVWTIGYGATPSRWIEDVMPMEDRALNLLNHLSIKNIGDKPIIFITHSMGGLITKHILEQAQNNNKPEYKRIAKNTKGVVFLAVPHNGSGWASLLDAARSIIRGNKFIEQIEKDSPSLRRLTNSFSQIVSKYSLDCLTFFETKELRIKGRFFGSKGIKIVSESSAQGNFPQETPVSLDADHLSICKLDSREDQLYGNIQKFIEKHLATPAIVVDDPPTKPQKIQVSKLPHTNSQLFGREDELTLLNKAWDENKTNTLSLIAFGGTGKTALMQTWLTNLGDDNYRGANAVYTWSFYSQGSAEDKQASADEFFDAALSWFGYNGEIIKSAHDKGLKLAELINQQRTLLILDGLEPLQYPQSGAMDGALRDQGLKTLCLQLTANNNGLLLISSRQPVIELKGNNQPKVILHELGPLSNQGGIALFRANNILGTEQELIDTVTGYNGHALSLNLLAKYLSDYEDSDIKQRRNLHDLTEFPEDHPDSRHAYKVMAAYERQLKDTPDLQILYQLGLFDRPVSDAALQHLRDAEIEQISKPAINTQVFNAAVKRLRDQDLVNEIHPEAEQSNKKTNLDTHPLVRSYFGQRLAVLYPEAWQQAQLTLYEYYKDLPDKHQPDELDEFEPLFAAIAHGCAAGLHQQSMDEVYYPRIQREDEDYLVKKLGAFGTDLSALAHFFKHGDSEPWQTPVAELNDYKADILNWAAFSLRALGRLQEAVQPMQASLAMYIEQKEWINAAIAASNLSELQLTRGELDSALKAAQQSVDFADKNDDAFERLNDLTTLADAQHQAGELSTARASFIEAEKLQLEYQPDYPQLYSLPGYRYCDLLLAAGEWRQVQQRAEKTLEYRHNPWYSLLAIALDQLSLGRASLQQAISLSSSSSVPGGLSSTAISLDTLLCPQVNGTSLSTLQNENAQTIKTNLKTAKHWLDQTVDGLRAAGDEEFIIRGLLVRTSYHRYALSLEHRAERGADQPNSTTAPTPAPALSFALADLQTVHDTAQRSGMRLHLTDYHLEAARLALTLDIEVHEQSAKQHLAQARELIAATGYKRRLPELQYLEKILSDDS